MNRTKQKPPSPYLVNKLTVEEARHLLNNEGGEIDFKQVVFHVISSLIVSGFCAWAIWVGKATSWHLVLPMFAEYFALMMAMPVLCFAFRVQELRPETISSLRWIAFFCVGVAVYIGINSFRAGVAWLDQGKREGEWLWHWITHAQMHWAILGAMVSMWIALPRRVKNLRKYGPPFCGVSLGCGMRLGMFFLCAFLLPFIAANPASLVWLVWVVILSADLGALYMRWDIQKRLKRVNA